MYQINQITTDPQQKQTLILPTGQQFLLQLEWMPIQQGWFIRNLTYQSFVLNNLRIVVSPNMLQQWRNIIPFGIQCQSDNQREPSLQQDFFSKACRLYVLTQAECQQYQDFLTLGP